jgi:hypothetical protein
MHYSLNLFSYNYNSTTPFISSFITDFILIFTSNFTIINISIMYEDEISLKC